MAKLKLRKLCLIVFSLFSIIFVNASLVFANSPNISHSYVAYNSVQNGSLVSLVNNKPGYVEAANVNNQTKLIGIVVNPSDSLIAIESAGSNIQVATSGTTSTLVSNINGPISVGDQITASPINGIGMKAISGGHIIGIAQSSFNSNSLNAQLKQVKDDTGKNYNIYFGYISLNIAPGLNNSSNGQANLTKLQKFVQSITGKIISTARIYASFAIAVIAVVALMTLIYSTIYGSIISIGRNPLAKNAVYKSLSSVVILAVLTTLISSILIYFLLV